MTKANVYEPRRGTLPHKVIEFLTTHPDEALGKDEIGVKFDVSANTVHSKLGLAVELGVLRIEEDLATGELVYRMGKGVPSILPAPGRHPTLAAHNVFNPPTPPAHKKRELFQIDLGTVAIRDGVPLPPRGRAKSTDWDSLLERLQVGQMFEVPKAARYTLSAAITQRHKDGQRVFETRWLGENFGVWRTA